MAESAVGEQTELDKLKNGITPKSKKERPADFAYIWWIEMFSKGADAWRLDDVIKRMRDKNIGLRDAIDEHIVEID